MSTSCVHWIKLFIAVAHSCNVFAGDQSCAEALREPVECYECTSFGLHGQQYCADTFNKSHPHIQSSMCDGACTKWVRKPKDGPAQYIRTCSSNLSLRIAVSLVCMKESRPGDGRLCFCQRNLCNAGSSSPRYAGQSFRSLYILLAILLAAILSCPSDQVLSTAVLYVMSSTNTLNSTFSLVKLTSVTSKSIRRITLGAVSIMTSRTNCRLEERGNSFETNTFLNSESTILRFSEMSRLKNCRQFQSSSAVEEEKTERLQLTYRLVSIILSQPMTSQPMTSQPMTSQPMTSQPMTSQPMTSQPMTSQSMTSQPMTSQPMTLQEKLLSLTKDSPASLQRVMTRFLVTPEVVISRILTSRKSTADVIRQLKRTSLRLPWRWRHRSLRDVINCIDL